MDAHGHINGTVCVTSALVFLIQAMHCNNDLILFIMRRRSSGKKLRYLS